MVRAFWEKNNPLLFTTIWGAPTGGNWLLKLLPRWRWWNTYFAHGNNLESSNSTTNSKWLGMVHFDEMSPLTISKRYNKYKLCIYHGPPKPEVFTVNNLVFRWPKPLCSMVLGAHGRYSLQRNLTWRPSTYPNFLSYFSLSEIDRPICSMYGHP